MKLVLSLLVHIIVLTANAQTGTITGKISSAGKPVEGASISLVGTALGTWSDGSGSFTVTGVQTGTCRLRVSCLGYETIERLVLLKSGEQLVLHIAMNANDILLNDVVVTGVSRATFTKENPLAIVGISPRAIERTAESNLMDVLARHVPGLHMVKTGPNVSKPAIRGLGYNRVLTLYDGIRQEGQQWGDEHSIEVDAYDINKAEVIKGPASLMYGSDALAGVISLFPYIPDNEDVKRHGKFVSEYQPNKLLVGNGFRLGYNGKEFVIRFKAHYPRATT